MWIKGRDIKEPGYYVLNDTTSKYLTSQPMPPPKVVKVFGDADCRYLFWVEINRGSFPLENFWEEDFLFIPPLDS